MPRALDRVLEALAVLLTSVALGASGVVGCTAAQRQHAATALEAADLGCELAQLVHRDDGRLEAVCLGVDGAQRLLEQLRAREAGGAAGEAGAGGSP